MGWWVVVERELRAAARRPELYRWRVLLLTAVIVLTLPIFIGWNGVSGLALYRLGWELFVFWSGLLILGCWLSGLLTADCISRERPEGTLGLLFLRKLTPGTVLAAK